MLSQSVILPPELLVEIENFVEENEHLGYTTRKSSYVMQPDGG